MIMRHQTRYFTKIFSNIGVKDGCHGYFMILHICSWVVYKASYGMLQKIFVIITAVRR